MAEERCPHDMLLDGSCADCRPRTRAATAANSFVRIEPARLYHLPDCDEVTWDPAEAEQPGERVTLTREQVQRLLADGVLERGGFCCHADARR